MNLKNPILIVLFLISTFSFAQKKKKCIDYITELRPKYKSEKIFSTNNTVVEKVSFTENINGSLEVYSSLMKGKYKHTPIYVKGYSVLAYNGSNKQEGVNLRSRILRYFPEAKVQLKYIAPNFKLKAGPFTEKLDAVRVKEGLLRKGLTSVLVVPDKILITK